MKQKFFWLIIALVLTGCHPKHVEPTMQHKAQAKSIKQEKASAKAALKHWNDHYHIKQDRAPKGPLPSRFAKVKPKYEAFSRYGNRDSYHVDGTTYRVLNTAKGFKERGLASWYGSKFHQYRTSSGEHYDVYGLTAAHRTLPLPTYVKVKNLQNGKTAIVKVNDRGPFHKGRIIDLSYGAAAKLGILPHGTAMVEIEAIKTQAHVAKYYLQAGAFSSMKMAQNVKKKIQSYTRAPIFVERYRNLFVVRVGPMENKMASQRLKAMMSNNGLKGAFSYLQ